MTSVSTRPDRLNHTELLELYLAAWFGSSLLVRAWGELGDGRGLGRDANGCIGVLGGGGRREGFQKCDGLALGPASPDALPHRELRERHGQTVRRMHGAPRRFRV